MNYSRKNTISQQKNDGQSYSLGITQSSGLDRLSGYPDNRSHGVGVQHRPSQTTHLIPTRIFLMCCTMRLFGQMARSKTTSLSSLTLAARIRTIFRQFRRRSTNWTTAFCSRRIAHGHIWDSKRKMMQSRKKTAFSYGLLLTRIRSAAENRFLCSFKLVMESTMFPKPRLISDGEITKSMSPFRSEWQTTRIF